MKILIGFVALLLLPATWAQQPVHVPAPIFRVPYGLTPAASMAPLEPSESVSYAPEGSLQPPVYGPLPCPPVPLMRRRYGPYLQPANPWGAPLEMGVVAGLLLTGFLILILAVPH